LDDLHTYECRVRQSELELQALTDEVVVSESWFFRDAQPFEWFRKYVGARWLGDRLRPPLRVLSLPCGAGEEPYSVAMTLSDLSLPSSGFQIDAVDVSDRQLAIAHRAIYSPGAFRSSGFGYRAQYFREHPQGYELAPEVRTRVRFFRASILDPRLLAGALPYDVLFCRNLLIYLTPSARAYVLRVIDRLLAADGLLFLGHADRLEQTREGVRFAADGSPGCFAYRRATQSPAGPAQAEDKTAFVTSSSLSRGNTSAGVVTPRLVASSALAAQAAERGATGTSSPVSGKRFALLNHAAELANKRRFDEAIAACQRHLGQNGLNPSAYYLMGMICQAAGSHQQAEECFRKTVYLDPRHGEALLALALLAERRGDHAAADRLRRRVPRDGP
jgi:chemotaxis protein methyltransferase WspC